MDGDVGLLWNEVRDRLLMRMTAGEDCEDTAGAGCWRCLCVGVDFCQRGRK